MESSRKIGRKERRSNMLTHPNEATTPTSTQLGETGFNPQFSLSNTFLPDLDEIQQVFESLQKFADKIKTFIEANDFYADLRKGGKVSRHINVAGWQLLGRLFGYHHRITSVEDLSTDKEIRFRAFIELLNPQMQVIGSCTSTCSNLEIQPNKSGWAKYAIESMAQTRAIGKVYRSLFGFLVEMVGFSATPLEEMPQEEESSSSAEKLVTKREKIKKWLNAKEKTIWITDVVRQEIEAQVLENLDYDALDKYEELLVANFKKATDKQVVALRKMLAHPVFSDEERDKGLVDLPKLGKGLASTWIGRLSNIIRDREGRSRAKAASQEERGQAQGQITATTSSSKSTSKAFLKQVKFDGNKVGWKYQVYHKMENTGEELKYFASIISRPERPKEAYLIEKCKYQGKVLLRPFDLSATSAMNGDETTYSIALHLFDAYCQAQNLDSVKAYNESYTDNHTNKAALNRHKMFAKWQGIKPVKKWDATAFGWLLDLLSQSKLEELAKTLKKTMQEKVEALSMKV